MTSTEKAIQARRFMVRGRVQGVGFRWFVEREAHILGIAGWVRNNADASWKFSPWAPAINWPVCGRDSARARRRPRG